RSIERAQALVAACACASYRPAATPRREIAVARSAKKATVSSQPQAPQIERPPQPKRFKASKEQLLQLYREMLLIRRFEERAGQLYGLGLIGGFCHLYIGQEAVAVGLQSP